MTRALAPALALPLTLLLACGDDGKASTGATATEGGSTAGSTAAATGSTGSTDTSTTGGAPAVTWYQDIQPIVAGHCWACHSPEGGIAFDLTGYEAAAAWSAQMLAKIEGTDAPSFFMPPWGARETATCAPKLAWKDDVRLNQDEHDLVAAWVADGAPAGDPATAAPLPPWMPEELAGGTVTQHAIAGYTIPAGDTSDHYACFSIDPALTGDRWITGLQVLPDNDAVVHHVVLFSDPSGAGADKAAMNGSYPCFGGAGVPDSDVLYAWAPGGNPLELPAESGIPVEAGQKIIMQIHYHPTGKEEKDASVLALRWTDQQPAHLAAMAVLGGVSITQANASQWQDPPFMIPAGAKGHREDWTEELDIPLGLDIRIWSIFPHMHLVGTSIESTLTHQGAESCLAAIPRWDFNWQRTYVYDVPFEQLPRAYGGDTLAIRCTYDNSMDNPLLARALEGEGKGAPADVVVGENTFDEMCTVIVGFLY